MQVFIMLKLHLCIFVALVLGGGFSAADKCPSNEDIKPCTCKNYINDAYVTCINLQNAEELREVLAGVKGHKIYSLEVKESYLGDVPGYLFKDTHIEEVSFTYAKMTSIGDDENPPFAGLENSLKRLTILEGFWDYEKPLTKPIKLSHLKKLTYLNMENNVIPKLGNEWFEDGPATLQQLYISTALAKEVGDKAFASLKNLRSLHFSGNSVTLKRSALPANPPFLNSLDLGVNEIEELPSDIFNDLPNLKYVHLDGNALRSLPESTWKSVLPQLQFVFFSANPLVCDSKIKWIFKQKLNDKIIGECASPENLSGKALESLTEDDIYG